MELLDYGCVVGGYIDARMINAVEILQVCNEQEALLCNCKA